MKLTPSLAKKALDHGNGTLMLDLVRIRLGGITGWVAVIRGTSARPMPNNPMPLVDLALTLTRRYLATVDIPGRQAMVQLRDAMRNPTWGDKMGALPEIAETMQRAGLI